MRVDFGNWSSGGVVPRKDIGKTSEENRESEVVRQ
jgi:hypothetical protein